MRLLATEFSASPCDDGNLASLWFRDATQDYCFGLSRFAGEQDDGCVDVLVLDQIHLRTKAIAVTLHRTRLVVHLQPSDATALDGVAEYEVRFEATEEEVEGMRQTLLIVFRDLPGFSDGCAPRARSEWPPGTGPSGG
jgi:hypothetical protein